MPVDTGVLTISKTVEGQKNPTEKFTFTVNLPEGEYPYIYSTAQGNDEVSGTFRTTRSVTLSSGPERFYLWSAGLVQAIP